MRQKKSRPLSRLLQNKDLIGAAALLRRHAVDGILTQDHFALILHGGKLRVILVVMRRCVKTQIQQGFKFLVEGDQLCYTSFLLNLT